MSPSRRQFLAALAGSATGVALAPLSISAQSKTEYDAFVEIRDQLVALQDRNDASESCWRTAECAINILNMTIIRECPHGRETWELIGIDPRFPEYGDYQCAQCKTWGSFLLATMPATAAGDPGRHFERNRS